MKKEVYCDNCKYHEFFAAGCKKEYENSAHKREAANTYTKNRRNDCKDYKLKWWKIWV